MATLKQTKTINGTTDNSLWTWKQVIYEYWDDDYVTTNKSRVVVQSYIGRSSSSQSSQSFGGTATTNITCAGDSRSKSQTWIYQSFYISPGDWKLIQEETFYVEHSSDGTKTISVSSSLSTSDFKPNYASASGSVTLTTIPRATPAVNVTVGVEDSTSFTLVPYSTTFSHSVYINTSDPLGVITGTTGYLKQDGTISRSEIKYPASGTNTWTFKPDKKFYDAFDGYSDTGFIRIKTYSGDTLVGTKDGVLTIQATAAHCTPKITGTVIDTNGTTINLTGGENNVVRYMSILKATTDIQISSTNDSNATLTALQYNGTNASSLSDRTFTVYNTSSKSVSIYAKNSRTHSKTQSLSASGSFIEYVIPTITITSAKRTEPTTGDARIEFKGDYFNGNFSSTNANTITVTWKYKEKSSDDYVLGGNITPTIKDNTYSGVINVDGLFDYKKQYDIIIVVEDRLNTVSAITSISRGFPIFWWSENFVDILTELRVNGTNIVKKYDDAISSINTNISSIKSSVSTLNTKVNDLSNIGYAMMYTTFTSKDFTSGSGFTKVTGWSHYLSYGDIEDQPSSSRIKITNTNLIQIQAETGGYGNAYIELIIEDSSGNVHYYSQELIQPSGNNYWHQTFTPAICYLDETKTYYLSLYAAGYNTTFSMNSGFHENHTRLSALKIK